MKLIALTQGKYAKVDDADFEWLNKFKWYAFWSPQSQQWYAGRVRTKEEDRRVGKRAQIAMHGVIFPAPKGKQIDHKNQNGLDNRRSNLRHATKSQNCANRRKRKSRTGFKGVYHSTAPMVDYYALIVVRQQRIRLGRFSDPLEAARAYDKAALKHFGEFAVINGV